MAELKLHDLELSGNCYKIRLFCALLGLKPDIAPVDFLSGAHKKSPLIERNPFGEVPVLEDGDLTLRDFAGDPRLSRAEIWRRALAAHRARAHGRGRLLADGRQNEIARGPNDARLHDKFGDDLDVDLARAKPSDSWGEAYLKTRRWLVLDGPTIADIACMPYVALSHEGGVSLDPYPAIRAWISRIKALPGFISMPAL